MGIVQRMFALLTACLVLVLYGCAAVPVILVSNPPVPQFPPPLVDAQRPIVGLALGGGAARGFAHAGVLKALDDAGIQVDLIVGTSAGSLAGALYAGGIRGDALVAAALELERRSITDWMVPGRGFIRGDLLQQYVNDALGGRALEQLDIRFAAVATDLQTGRLAVFSSGNTGMAVRASSAVPGVFVPVNIGGRDYVDGGVASPVPVNVARRLGADLVIAVDVSRLPSRNTALASTLDVLRQSLLIMGQVMVASEAREADVLIKPDVSDVSLTDFESRADIIAAGVTAAEQALPTIRRSLEDARRRKSHATDPPAAPTDPS